MLLTYKKQAMNRLLQNWLGDSTLSTAEPPAYVHMPITGKVISVERIDASIDRCWVLLKQCKLFYIDYPRYRFFYKLNDGLHFLIFISLRMPMLKFQ